MNWKLIGLLALTGPLLAVAGIYGLIGFSAEPYVVLGIFILAAIAFAMFNTGKYFLHGFVTALLFGTLLSIIRLKFLQQYINANPDAIDKGENFLHWLHFIRSPMVILVCLILIPSIVAGTLAWIASLFVKKPG